MYLVHVLSVLTTTALDTLYAAAKPTIACIMLESRCVAYTMHTVYHACVCCAPLCKHVLIACIVHCRRLLHRRCYCLCYYHNCCRCFSGLKTPLLLPPLASLVSPAAAAAASAAATVTAHRRCCCCCLDYSYIATAATATATATAAIPSNAATAAVVVAVDLLVTMLAQQLPKTECSSETVHH
jgi:hypothetical protein